MARNVLGISWLHGQFQASTANGAAWSSPVPVSSAQEFSAALSTAVQETPPARGKMLAKLLARLVAQNQFFDEPVAYGHVELPVSKGHHRFLLSLLTWQRTAKNVSCKRNDHLVQ